MRPARIHKRAIRACPVYGPAPSVGEAMLLSNTSEFAGAEAAFRDAPAEIPAGNPSGAITDAGTALLEALTALGCEGNSLAKLGVSAKERGLFAPHDATLADAIRKIID